MTPNDDMARNQGGDSRPTPDPTVLTTDALLREVGHLKELLEAKLQAQANAQTKVEESVREAIRTIGAKLDDLRDRVSTIESVVRERPAQRAAQQEQLAGLQRQVADLTERVSKIA